jgi:arsenate reductase (thioredoxin)
MEATRKLKILFLCTGNSCRSQMAEGWAGKLTAQDIEPYSAGVEPRAIDPRAVKAMAEAGIDISGQRSKHVHELKGIEFDFVITLCGQARETCPVFLGKTKVVHHGFEDPPKLAASAKTEEEAMSHYRRIRDEIKEFVRGLPGNLGDERPVFISNL